MANRSALAQALDERWDDQGHHLPRPLTLAQAQARYPHRFTLDHFPAWAAYPLRRSLAGEPLDYPAPQYRSDEEWYERTTFPGEGSLSPASHWYISARQTWPLGQRLPEPYRHVPRETPTPNPDRKPVTRDPKEVRDGHTR